VSSEVRLYMTGAYCFHGSEARGLAALEPATPRDVGNDPRNKDVAVYATDDPVVAIPFGLTRGLSGVWCLSHEPTTIHFPESFRETLGRNVGALYVLPRDEFVEDGEQYKAVHAVVPVAEVSVTLHDYLELGGTVTFSSGGDQ
jgi:hypothetical protein